MLVGNSFKSLGAITEKSFSPMREKLEPEDEKPKLKSHLGCKSAIELKKGLRKGGGHCR